MTDTNDTPPPRTAAATAAAKRRAEERRADYLRARGWTCTPPQTPSGGYTCPPAGRESCADGADHDGDPNCAHCRATVAGRS